MTRRAAQVGAILVAFVLAGCLIKGPEPVPPIYTNIRIYPTSNDRPPFGLEPAPAGYVYQLWLIDLDASEGGSLNFRRAIPLQRFQWNSQYYFAVSDKNDTLPLTTAAGLDIGTNVLDHQAMALSIEPLNDPDSSAINGPIIMGGFISDNVRQNLTLDMVPPFEQTSQATCLFSMMLASNAKRTPGTCWRDPDEGMGIWFAEPGARDHEILETVALCRSDTCSPGAGQSTCRHNACPDSIAKGTRFGMKFIAGVKNIRGPDYNLWIFPSHPESSFSTFNGVFPNQEPDLVFRDGAARHALPKTGPLMKLGEFPILRDGSVVGYMFFRDSLGAVDTCFLRLDVPESTHCTMDTFAYAQFNDTSIIVRSFTTTWGDTTYSTTLPSLPVLDPLFRLEYEAWVVFDSSGGAIKPLSLGRFTRKDQLDEGNSHFDVTDLDSAFKFPGEDLLKNIAHPGLPATNLNLLSLLRDRRLKVWITLEPVQNDWAVDEPYRQLIVYSAEIGRDFGLFEGVTRCEQRVPGNAPPAYEIPMTFREVSASSSSINEGHNWPRMHVVLQHSTK